MTETLSTNTEAWWKDFIGHLGRFTRNKPASTGTDDQSFLVKLAVNDINEVVKGFLIATEEKERDNAAKKVIKTIEVATDQASKNECHNKQLKFTEVSEYLKNDPDRKVKA